MENDNVSDNMHPLRRLFWPILHTETKKIYPNAFDLLPHCIQL